MILGDRFEIGRAAEGDSVPGVAIGFPVAGFRCGSRTSGPGGKGSDLPGEERVAVQRNSFTLVSINKFGRVASARVMPEWYIFESLRRDSSTGRVSFRQFPLEDIFRLHSGQTLCHVPRGRSVETSSGTRWKPKLGGWGQVLRLSDCVLGRSPVAKDDKYGGKLIAGPRMTASECLTKWLSFRGLSRNLVPAKNCTDDRDAGPVRAFFRVGVSLSSGRRFFEA